MKKYIKFYKQYFTAYWYIYIKIEKTYTLLIFQGCHKEISQTGQLNKNLSSHSSVGSSPRSSCQQVWILMRHISRAYRYLFYPCILTLPLLYACIPGVSSSSYQHTSPIKLGAHPMTLFNFDCVSKGSVSKYNYMGVRAPT